MTYLRKNYKNLIMLLIGITLMAIGGLFFIHAELGSDALMVLNQGVATFLNMSVGNAMIVTNIIGLVVIIILYRSSIGIGTIAVTVLLGVILNFINGLNIISHSDHFILNLLMVLSAIVFGGFGVALYIFSNTGFSPFEGLIIYIVEKTNIRFGIIKIINDIIFFGIGYLLGGVVGIGSIIAVIMFGPIIDFYLVMLNKIKARNKSDEIIEQEL